MEVEEDPAKARRLQRRRRLTKACLWGSAAVLILIVLLIVILSLTVFKPKRPVTSLNSVSLSDLDVSFSGFSPRINVSLAVDLSIRNPNKVGFEYENSMAYLDYRGTEVGDAPIPAGQISAGETKAMSVVLTVMADRLLSKSQAYKDVLSGTLPLSARTSVSGRVSILGFIRIHVVSHTDCKLAVNVAGRNVTNDGCDYKTEL